MVMSVRMCIVVTHMLHGLDMRSFCGICVDANDKADIDICFRRPMDGSRRIDSSYPLLKLYNVIMASYIDLIQKNDVRASDLTCSALIVSTGKTNQEPHTDS